MRPTRKTAKPTSEDSNAERPGPGKSSDLEIEDAYMLVCNQIFDSRDNQVKHEVERALGLLDEVDSQIHVMIRRRAAPKRVAPGDKQSQNAESTLDTDLASLTEDPGSPADIEWNAALRKRLRALPDSYEEARRELAEVRHALHDEVALALSQRFNDYLKSLPQDTYEDKQEIARRANAELHELGLAIKCPKTGRPAILVADQRDARKTSSRFRLEIRDEAGKRTRTISSETLPELELMEDELRAEPIAKWTSAVRREGQRRGKDR